MFVILFCSTVIYHQQQCWHVRYQEHCKHVLPSKYNWNTAATTTGTQIDNGNHETHTNWQLWPKQPAALVNAKCDRNIMSTPNHDDQGPSSNTTMLDAHPQQQCRAEHHPHPAQSSFSNTENVESEECDVGNGLDRGRLDVVVDQNACPRHPCPPPQTTTIN